MTRLLLAVCIIAALCLLAAWAEDRIHERGVDNDQARRWRAAWAAEAQRVAQAAREDRADPGPASPRPSPHPRP
ncbi:MULTISPECIES: hypothetical protein [Streptomycetaceae]|uniref:hypothetical protein n=1 Tax=Streptomycetaceae TaxID=2062 RepID=UPI00093CFC81|nr:hypothetical protein [Streptomyces sp. CB02056]OKI08808.1 hypothetical protein AMK13_10430 [Streptomyces sp. CB02056]